MVEPAHFGQFHDLAHARRLDGSRLGRVFAQRKMGPCPALAGKELGPAERRHCCQIVKPGTILGWLRELAARRCDSSRRKTGRPHKARDRRKLKVKMAIENETWGYTKIRDALRTGLKIEIGRSTVANILKEAGIEPAPEREKKRT
jgi:transposase